MTGANPNDPRDILRIDRDGVSFAKPGLGELAHHLVLISPTHEGFYMGWGLIYPTWNEGDSAAIDAWACYKKNQHHKGMCLIVGTKMITEMDFALEEYKTLRKEILDKMERSYKILSLGVGGIAVILGFVFGYEIYELFFVLPWLILANAHLYRGETNAIINAGTYIKKIENSIYKKDFGDMGWENYLEKRNKRKIYKPHKHAAYIIFGSLYVMCIIGVFECNKNLLEIVPLGIIISFYILVGLLFLLID